MKKIIRNNTFETNSSSTHSLTMCLKSDYEAWQRGEVVSTENVYLYKGDKTFITIDEALDFIKTEEYYKNKIKDYNLTDKKSIRILLDDLDFGFYDDDNYELEKFYDEFTTSSGEIVVAFGEYGYDG
ncbi:hypothetical protein CWE04_11435 [Thomasclavelia cocleata]|uniref:Uncharacterized protein n=1 Tax=Thomasclavelia cocleata TaxID=69824 RepID=A0A1I0GCU1_9FIRM|nr:hypothetical protein [Thomasclavelia cocleata]MCR1959860.1 hypothetical protein [Thomasclavelia cocleata]NDO43210.1 hypothetical protein [Thomasclavelia cocleata]PJN79818.1 hypothetical protein CWE04_11435 [Thomasclavelia cocleata]SET68826.1 hypothetical protein SAMN04489758_12836 [Thomasclavelia cocleata]